MSNQTYHTAQPSDSGSLLDSVPSYLYSPQSLTLVGCGVALLLLSGLNKGEKRRSATGHFSGAKEKQAAYKRARQQILKRERNSVALYIGQPTLFGKAPLVLPDAQRGTAVVGGPGSGKTFSIIDPSIRSAIEQGFPVILYDFKYPTQTSRVAGYAKEHGYEVRIFAPGHPESETCNPLDFLEDQTDSLMARQMAEVLNKNFASGSINKSEDPFFC